MERVVETELLDVLPAEDVQARRSRGDLRRINNLMANARILRRLLETAEQTRTARRIVDLGSGDGTLLLKIVRQLDPRLAVKHAVLLDQQQVAPPEVGEALARLGWRIEIVKQDVFVWLAESGARGDTVLIANLFLHHFGDAQLRRLLELAAERCRVLVACEPRRTAGALIASRLLGLIGCNRVTRHDAVSSVRAGFRNNELSALWPSAQTWELREGNAGLFSHAFRAVRKNRGEPSDASDL